MKATTNYKSTNGGHLIAKLIATVVLLSAFALAKADNADFAEGRVLVKLRPAASLMRSSNPLPGIASLRPLDPNATAARSADTATWFVADLDANLDVDSALDMLAERDDVEFVEPDYIVRAPGQVSGQMTGSSMNDPAAGDQYALTKIQAEAAWQINGGSANVIVAVVDTGVQLDHPDLQSQIWRNNGETMNGIDDDGNGLIDDVRGWNFISNTNNPSDDQNHGTHVAGIIAAVRDNQVGIAGAADVTIMPVKVLGSDMSGPTSGVIEGVRYAMNNGASVINLSLSSASPSQAFQDMVDEAASRNVVVCAAAGNAGQDVVEFPAGFDSVIAVGATDSGDNLANFSNAGPGIELVAPGVQILSTVRGSNYETMDGTSMATPYVAGVAALIRSAEPNLTAAQVRDRLKTTADDLGNSGYDQLFGNGRINAARALGAAGQPTPPNGTPTPVSGNDDSFEDNDTHEAAKPIQPGSHNLMGNDDDWFSMSVSGYFAIDVQSDAGDLDLFVFEADGTPIGSSESETSFEFVEGFSESGTIFIAVSPYEGQTAAYTLTIETEGMDSFDEPGFEDDTFGFDDDEYGFEDDLGGFDDLGLDLSDNTLIVPVTCGVGAMQMMAAMIVGCIGLGAASRRRTVRRMRK